MVKGRAQGHSLVEVKLALSPDPPTGPQPWLSDAGRDLIPGAQKHCLKGQ